MAEKIIRDPVHDVIAFALDRPVDALLYRLINAQEFQRLRRIRQLGMAHFAYPGADHSRYSHSLGVMETARRILLQLRRSFAIDDQQEAVCLSAALLHDLGHGPFSHVFERVSGIHHERLTQRVIMDPGSEVHRILFQFDKLMPENVLRMLADDAPRDFFHDILSSQLDADRLDYLLRDNHMTGSGYGDFDLNWLLHAFTIDPSNNRLAVTGKGVSAVEAYLQARYHMYRNVYFHKVVRSAEGMVKLALQRARRLAVQDRLEALPRDGAVSKALLAQRFTMDEFRDLDDVSVWHCFKVWAEGPDAILASLCRGLLFRKLYKTVDLTSLEPATARRVMDLAAGSIAIAGGDPQYDLFYDEPSDTPYQALPGGPTTTVTGTANTTVAQAEPHAGKSASAEIMVIDSAGVSRHFTAMSPLTQSLNHRLLFRRIHVKAEYKPQVMTALQTATG